MPAMHDGDYVVRYLRRDKALEHSVESARWYYARMIEGLAINPTLAGASSWGDALTRLELILTKEKRVLARGGESNAQ